MASHVERFIGDSERSKEEVRTTSVVSVSSGGSDPRHTVGPDTTAKCSSIPYSLLRLSVSLLTPPAEELARGSAR
ncbi:hypothetical protein DPEC_G00119450 [Dallia pectoralis]|uniref:Uncharacterized protein n=1 Tax=Dallia pectoralis TaxID=75939 RepID=A0ACC2GPP0_DALPE|nr:hypothetical protein DPEC_G00119450 [Dallia pectoralis]